MNYLIVVVVLVLVVASLASPPSPSPPRPPTPPTPPSPHPPRCNPYTAYDAPLPDGETACVCKYPDLVINDGGRGDCTRVVACGPQGTLVHRVTRRPFDGTWDPRDWGECDCGAGETPRPGPACGPDPCAPHGRLDGGQCRCDDGFLAWDGPSCVTDPCAPHGRFRDGTCSCDPGYLPQADPTVPGHWTCVNPCLHQRLCGNRGTCVTDGHSARCVDCRYPFHQSPDGLCRGVPKDADEPCDTDDECLSRLCRCRGDDGHAVCCLP